MYSIIEEFVIELQLVAINQSVGQQPFATVLYKEDLNYLCSVVSCKVNYI